MYTFISIYLSIYLSIYIQYREEVIWLFIFTMSSPGVGGNSCALQGYLAHKKTPTPWDPTVGLSPGSYDGPTGGRRFLMSQVPL